MGQPFHSSTFSNETQTLIRLHAWPRTACYTHIGLVSLLSALKTQIQRMHKRLSYSKVYAVTTLVPAMVVLKLKESKYTTVIPPTFKELCIFWTTDIRSRFLQTKPTTEVLTCPVLQCPHHREYLLVWVTTSAKRIEHSKREWTLKHISHCPATVHEGEREGGKE